GWKESARGRDLQRGRPATLPCDRDAGAASLRAVPGGEDQAGRENPTARRRNFRPRARAAESGAGRAGGWEPSQNGWAKLAVMQPGNPPGWRAGTQAPLPRELAERWQQPEPHWPELPSPPVLPPRRRSPRPAPEEFRGHPRPPAPRRDNRGQSGAFPPDPPCEA